MIKAKLFGEVYDMTEFVETFKGYDDDIELEINSPGGSVFDGLQLCHAIQNQKHCVTAKISVMAASIAGVIALACDRVEIDKNSLIMLHNCWTFTVGNKEELQNEIEAMQAIDTILHNYIKEHCSKAEEIEERLNSGDVWLTGEEAAELFENVDLVEIPLKEGEKKDCASLVDLLNGYRSYLGEKNSAHAPAPAPEPEPADPNTYAISPEMEALLTEILGE